MKNIITIGLIVLAVVFLFGCGNAEEKPILPSQTLTTPTITLTLTATLAPTPTSYPKYPTEWPMHIQAHYDIPSWVSDPESTVALLVLEDELVVQYSFVNMATTEMFNLPLWGGEISGYFWLPDRSHFGFLSNDRRSMYLFNIATGEVTQEKLSPRAIRFIVKIRGLIRFTASTSDVTDPDFYLYQDFYRYSLDYVDKDSVEIIDWETRNTSLITEPDGVDYIGWKWSPTEDILAVLQAPDEMRPHIGAYPGTKILLFDLNGNILASYKAEFLSDFRWSPDGTMILSGTADWEDDYPCILHLDTGEVECFNEIESGIYGEYKWMPDSKTILYACNENLEGKNLSGLCKYEIDLGKSTRFLVEDIKWGGFANFFPSPNGKYVIFRYPDCYLCEMPPPNRRIGVVSIDGSIRYDIPVDSKYFDFYYWRSFYWWSAP